MGSQFSRKWLGVRFNVIVVLINCVCVYVCTGGIYSLYSIKKLISHTVYKLHHTLTLHHIYKCACECSQCSELAQNKNEILFRSFPGFFRKEVRGKKRFGPYKRPEKSFLMVFFLLDQQYEKTPKGETELQLTLAGLGRRSLTITENMTHSEVRLMSFFLFFLCWVNFLTLFYSAFDN